MDARQANTLQWVEDRNLEWGSRLRRVSLIVELEVADDELERAERVLSLLLARNQPEDIARRHPAFVLVAMTSAAMRSWEEGTFYSKVAATLGIRKDQAEAATAVYHRCLTRFGLPTFGEAKGMRWVTPVLLHGAVPLDHLDELLDLLAVRRRRDPTLTGETFVEWARLSAASLASQPKALTRFLEFGGDFATDFVSRVMDVIDGGDARLPRRVTERLQEYLGDGHGVVRVRRDARPTVALTWDGSVIIRLPSVEPTQARSVTWRVHMGDRVVERTVSAPWGPGRPRTPGLSVPVGAPLREITIDRDESSAVIPFVRREDPLLVYDADGELVAPSRAIPPGVATVMWPSGGLKAQRPVDGAGLLVEGREKDAPFGWDGWSLLETVVRVGDTVRLGAGPLRRVAGADRACVVAGPIIPGLLTADGREVTSELPLVVLPPGSDAGDWTIAVTDSLGNRLKQPHPEGGSVRVDAERDGSFCGELEVSVRGPLGRGVTRRVAVAEGVAMRSEPPHRPLLREGGVAPANVRLVRGERLLAEVNLSPAATRELITLDRSPGFVVEPPHVSFALIERGVPGPWRCEPIALTAGGLDDGILRVRGLPAVASPRLAFRSGATSQEIGPLAGRREGVDFKISALTDMARQVGSGSIFLDTGERSLIAVLRPDRLVGGISYAEGHIVVEPLVGEPLELVIHRRAAPWEDGVVVPIESGAASLPARLIGRGPLRLLVRVANEWITAPTGAFPRVGAGADVFDVPMLWAPDSEIIDELPVVRALLQALPEAADVVTAQSAARTVEMLGAGDQVNPQARAQLVTLLASHPLQAIAGVLTTAASTRDVTVALVEAGLAGAPVHEVAAPNSVESLLARSALAAVLASSQEVGGSAERSAAIRALLASELGEDLSSLWSGARDDAALGRFEPEFERMPERVRTFYDYLDPVPARVLDADTRVAAVYEMWTARALMRAEAEAALPTINIARRVIRDLEPSLWPMVEARLSHDGVIALPALSIALALVSRLAARREGAARQLIQNRRRMHAGLARHAPGLTAIDLIRADAAVIGATQ